MVLLAPAVVLTQVPVVAVVGLLRVVLLVPGMVVSVVLWVLILFEGGERGLFEEPKDQVARPADKYTMAVQLLLL